MYDDSLRPGLEDAMQIVLKRFDVEYERYQTMWKQGSSDDAMMKQENKLLAYNDVIVALTNRLLVLQ